MIGSDSTVIPLVGLGLRPVTVAPRVGEKGREISLLSIKSLNTTNENGFSGNGASVTVLPN